MELRPDYKHSAIGVIPEGWAVRRLGDLVSDGPTNGYSGRGGKDAQGTLTLKLTATTSGYLILNDGTSKRLNETIDSGSDLFLRSGDVLVQRSNTSELVGTTAIFNGPSGVYIYPDLMMRLRLKDPSVADWIWRYANSFQGRQFFVSIAAGSTGTMPKISGERLREMRVPLPPSHERRAIGSALGDVDALLGALDRLIAKKRDLKQAAMQQLLTGQTRLPGCSGDWEVKPLGHMLAVRHGKSQHGVLASDGRYPILATGGEIGRTNHFLHDKPSVLIGRKGTIDFPRYVETPFWTIDTLFYTEVSKDANVRFLFYKFHTIRWRNFNAASGVPSLNASTIERIELAWPKVDEQIAIAAVLSDVDAEIAAVEARRDKTRALKQGMMQELLTGKTRLI